MEMKSNEPRRAELRPLREITIALVAMIALVFAGRTLAAVPPVTGPGFGFEWEPLLDAGPLARVNLRNGNLLLSIDLGGRSGFANFDGGVLQLHHNSLAIGQTLNITGGLNLGSNAWSMTGGDRLVIESGTVTL